MNPMPSRSRPSRPLRSLRLTLVALSVGALGVATLGACGKLDVPPFVKCSVSPATLDFGSVSLGGSADRTFTVTNGGSETLSGSMSESCSDFALVGAPEYALDSGESQTFTLRFTPTAAGPRPCTISIGDCSTLTMSGQGLTTSSACGVSPTTLTFGTVAVGTSAEASFTITNTGATDLSGTVKETCPEFSLVGQGDYDLPPSGQATFTVRFAPTSAGPKSCTIDTDGLCADVSASGTGQTPTPTPQCQVSTSALAFGTVTVGQSATRTFTIENVGGGTLTGSVSESCPDFSIDGSSGYSLGAGQSATFTVRFTPTSAGTKNCTIDTDGQCANVSASGTGQTPAPTPRCEVSTATLSFGTVDVGQSATRTFTIENVGGGTLTGNVSESCLEFSIDGSSGYSLGAGQSATFTARFTPLTPGDKNCTFNTGAGCANVTATGTGQLLAPSCQLSATSIDFLDVSIGQTGDRLLVVTNTGLGTLSGTLTESCPQFSIVGTASYSLAPLQAATFTLRFAPTALGGATCTLDAGAPCGTVSLRGRGVPPPECELSAVSYDFGEVEVSKHKDHSFDVRNVGGGQLCGAATESCEMFSIEGTASYCAIPGTPFHLKVSFLPTRAGSFECVVNPGSGCPAITVRGVGK